MSVHMKTPGGATPTQPSTYSQLDRPKVRERAGSEKEEYHQLDHKKGRSITLETVSMQPYYKFVGVVYAYNYGWRFCALTK